MSCICDISHTSVYVTVSLNKPYERCLTVYTGFHISALSEMLSRQLSQTKFITHISGAFPINSVHKQNRSPTVCQQCVAISNFQQLKPIIFLEWWRDPDAPELDTTLSHPCTQQSKHEKMLNRIAESIKLQVFKSNECIRALLQFKSNCSGFPIVKTLALEGQQLQNITHADKTQTGP